MRAKSKKQNPLIGSWVNGDEYATEVEYIIARPARVFTVRAVDRFDGEEGGVYDVRYDDKDGALSFSVHWGSTGRFVKVKVEAISQNRISYTYTFTENQMWFRKDDSK
jgi:hypothetical protein